MRRSPTVERALGELQRLVRRPPKVTPPRMVMSGRVPVDLQSSDCRMIGLCDEERGALERLRSLLPHDLRFEHLEDRNADEATWRFVCLAHLQCGDHVGEFVAQYARDPIDRTCFLPLELLTVSEELELLGVRLLPPSVVTPPEPFFGPGPTPNTGSAVAVPARGTNYTKMSLRARATAEHALRVLRTALPADRETGHRQLRFRLGTSVWFDDGAGGWTAAPDQGFELGLGTGLPDEVTSQAIWSLPAVPKTDVERRASLALRWFEQAQLNVDPVVKLLHLFFALEAILGDRSEGLKAPRLALRRATLGLLTTGSFTHPARTYLLYDEVRSAAVHGEEAPAIDQREAERFSWDVREAINEFLGFAQSRKLLKRSRIRAALDADEHQQSIADALRTEDPQLWRHLPE